jgi:hypothetical protein
MNHLYHDEDVDYEIEVEEKIPISLSLSSQSLKPSYESYFKFRNVKTASSAFTLDNYSFELLL